MATPRLASVGATRTQTAMPGSDNADVIALLRQLILVVQGLDLDIQLDGEKIKNNTVKRLNAHTRATGQPELIF